MSSKYHQTLGIDIDEMVIRNVNERHRFPEPLVNEYLQKFNLRAYSDFSKVQDCELIFVSVGSQSDEGYSSRAVLSSIAKTIPYLKSREQVLAVLSTLPLEAIERELMPFVQEQGLTERIRGICYNPAMIALGNVIRDFEHPNYILLGESNASAGGVVERYWRTIIGEKVPIFRSSLTNIALAKYSLNIALVLKITLMNMVTELSEATGGDVDSLSEIMKADPRLAGQKMFKGGLGYGGTCFPVDVEALRSECRLLDLPALEGFTKAIENLNDWQIDRSVQLIQSFGKKRVAVLGITFKPNTSVVINSQALQIARRLAGDHEVTIYDPAGLEEARKCLRDQVRYANSTKEAITHTEVIFLGTDWSEFELLGADDFKPDQIVVDPWRILRTRPLKCRYCGYGLRAKKIR
jgi:UDPglucose 6-dehydrogenase